jgi:molybdopterin-guanine dinucleotide biosynthesis protein A
VSALTGILLVGGESRRFGAPKALAELDGRTFAARAWELLGQTCTQRLAVGKPARGLRLPFPLLDDGDERQAPLVGVVAGLRAARTETCVVIPVDCPRLEADTIRALAAGCADAAVTQSGPLPLAIRTVSLGVLERSLATGELALYRALCALEVTQIQVDPAQLGNVNTPGDLRALAIAG